MTTSEKNNCKRCGAGVPPKWPGKICPACLMSGALDLAAGEAETVAPAAEGSQVLYEDSEFPCQFGDYQLLGLLGHGGMGTVYEAEQISTGRRVALKMLGQQLDSPEMRKRFVREGRLAAGVSHPNSLYVFGSEEIEGVPVITMEIAESGTLKDRLKKRGPLPTTEAVDAMLDVLAGLESAFAAGVLHRDIKPSNCFVGPDGSVKIGDFGLSVSTLAKDDTYITASGVIMGTPAYASPEQLRGDELDARADIYSAGATLFTLLTNRVPFEGENAVQVVANAVNKKPTPLSELCEDVPPGLERVVARCLAKEPDGRYASYKALRGALLPFSSKEPEPASLKVRIPAGWIDYLIAFLIPYATLMLAVGNEEFHLQFLMERTLYSARYYVAFLSFGILYFTLTEGIWGAGLGKRLKGLRVVRANGRTVGIGRALLRILIPVLSVEGVRIPFLLASISATQINDMTVTDIVLYSAATSICPWIPVLLSLSARRDNGYAAVWDLGSGTRVVIKPQGSERQPVGRLAEAEIAIEGSASIGPFRIIEELVLGEWLVATDPVLRRRVWLLRRTSSELSTARRNLARPGRLRWLQKVEAAGATWDAFEAPPGVPFSSLVEGGKVVPWSTLRQWLHDLATELWDATGDQTLPVELSLDQVWITDQGRAVLLDAPWPDVETPAESISVEGKAGQQRFLNAIAAHVDSTSLPLHARPVLRNLQDGKFEKLSFLTGILRGLLDKPAEVNHGIRAGSIFMLPFYVWVMIFVATYTAEGTIPDALGGSGAWLAMNTTILVLVAGALIQLLELPFRTTFGQSIFRLAVVNANGEPANISTLLARWAIVWLPLLLPMTLLALWLRETEPTAAFISALALLLLWTSAAVYAVIHPNRGLHDRLAGTWVVRR
jgi:uncharacterized RDD family membrane protein YckC